MASTNANNTVQLNANDSMIETVNLDTDSNDSFGRDDKSVIITGPNPDVEIIDCDAVQRDQNETLGTTVPIRSVVGVVKQILSRVTTSYDDPYAPETPGIDAAFENALIEELQKWRSTIVKKEADSIDGIAAVQRVLTTRQNRIRQRRKPNSNTEQRKEKTIEERYPQIFHPVKRNAVKSSQSQPAEKRLNQPKKNFAIKNRKKMSRLKKRACERFKNKVDDAPSVNSVQVRTSTPPDRADLPNKPEETTDPNLSRNWYPEKGLPNESVQMNPEKDESLMECGIDDVNLSSLNETELLASDNDKTATAIRPREASVDGKSLAREASSPGGGAVQRVAPFVGSRPNRPNMRPTIRPHWRWRPHASPLPPPKRRFFDPRLQVVLLAGDFVKKHEVNEIRARIVRRLSGWSEGPRFNDSSLRYERWLQVSCADADSADWLVRQHLGQLNGRPLRAMRLGEAPHRPVASVFFKGSRHDVPRAMELLRMQNYHTGLGVDAWRVVRSRRPPGGLQLILIIHTDDIPILMKLDFCVYFELHLVPIRLWNRDRPWGRAPLLVPQFRQSSMGHQRNAM